MTLFSNNKFFLKFNEIDATSVGIEFNDVIIDTNVANKMKAKKLRLTFLRYATIDITNNYFQSTINTTNNTLKEEDFSDDLKTKLSSENSDYEQNKILKHIRHPDSNFFIETDFSISNSDSDGLSSITQAKKAYDLTFNIDNFIYQLLTFYSFNKNEEFKFFVECLDENNNIIDFTDVITLSGQNYYNPVKEDVNILFNAFKDHIKDTIDIKVTEEGFLVKNHTRDFEDLNPRRFTLQEPPDDPDKELYYVRGSRPKIKFRKFNTYPSLNNAYINFIIENDPHSSSRGTAGFADGYRTPYIFGGQITLDDDNNEVKLLEDSELYRFLIYRKDQAVKLSYVAQNNSITTINLNDNDSWENNFSFFINALDFSASREKGFKDKILQDYNNGVNEFKFVVKITYDLKSYIQQLDQRTFTITKEIKKTKQEISLLYQNIIRNHIRSQLIKAFNFEITLLANDTSNPSIRLLVTRKNDADSADAIQFLNSSFGELFLNNIYRLIDSNQPAEIEDQSIFRYFSEDDQELSGPINLGTNSTLSSLLGISFYFHLPGQNDGGEILGEIILEISTETRDGESYKINLPVDIDDLEEQINDDSFVKNFIPDDTTSPLVSIEFNPMENYLYDFKISIDNSDLQTLAENLSYTDSHSLNNLAFFNRFISEIQYVKHFFRVNDEEIVITRENSKYKNFTLDVEEINNRKIQCSNILEKYPVLKFNTNDLTQLTNNYNRRIITAFIQDNREELAFDSDFRNVSYHIEVSFRMFCFPFSTLGLNDQYNNDENPSSIFLTYSTLSEYNRNISDSIKSAIHDLAYEKNPGSSLHKDIAVKWLSRDFDAAKRNQKITSVKNYFMNNLGYFKNSSSPSGITYDDLNSFRDNNIAYALPFIDDGEDLENLFYNIEHENHNDLSFGITLNSNLRLGIKYGVVQSQRNLSNIANFSNISSRPGNLANIIRSDFGGITNNNGISAASSQSSSTSVSSIDRIAAVLNNDTIKFRRKELRFTSANEEYITLTCENDGKWDDVRGVKVSLLPMMVNWNLKDEYLPNGKYTLSDSEEDFMFKFNDFWTFNVPNAEVSSWQYVQDNKGLKIIFNKDTQVEFKTSNYIQYCNSENSGLIKDENSTENFLNTTVSIGSNLTLNQTSNYSIHQLNKTFIVRDFFYRIEVNFNNGKSLFINYKVPKRPSRIEGQEYTLVLEDTDPLKLKYKEEDEELFTPTEVDQSLLENLAFSANYAGQENTSALKFTYGLCPISYIPGYTII